MPAPERAGGEYTGNPLTNSLGGTTGHQPQGPNNPNGDLPGIPAMCITGKSAQLIEGPPPESL